MSDRSQSEVSASATLWNLPNQITAIRIVASIVVFVCLHYKLYWYALVLFLLAAGTDWLDGYLARSRGLVTQLGRILDPLADKLIISGTFIFLCAEPASRIPAWLTVVVVARELIVTVVRSFLEQQGADFSANMPGKIKMVLQCAAAVASIMLLATESSGSVPQWLPITVTVLVWVAAISTVHSGVIYMFAAAKLLQNES